MLLTECLKKEVAEARVAALIPCNASLSARGRAVPGCGSIRLFYGNSSLAGVADNSIIINLLPGIRAEERRSWCNQMQCFAMYFRILASGLQRQEDAAKVVCSASGRR